MASSKLMIRAVNPLQHSDILEIDQEFFTPHWRPQDLQKVLGIPGKRLVAASRNGFALGFMLLQPYDQKLVIAARLAVRKSHRRQGIGTALINWALKFAQGTSLLVPVPDTVVGAQLFLRAKGLEVAWKWVRFDSMENRQEWLVFCGGRRPERRPSQFSELAKVRPQA